MYMRRSRKANHDGVSPPLSARAAECPRDAGALAFGPAGRRQAARSATLELQRFRLEAQAEKLRMFEPEKSSKSKSGNRFSRLSWRGITARIRINPDFITVWVSGVAPVLLAAPSGGPPPPELQAHAACAASAATPRPRRMVRARARARAHPHRRAGGNGGDVRGTRGGDARGRGGGGDDDNDDARSGADGGGGGGLRPIETLGSSTLTMK